MKKVISLCMVCLMVLSICAVFSCTKDDNEVNGRYVDLGLPSGTKWKTTNEKITADIGYNFFTYDEAIAQFGDRVPTKEQWEELKDNCTWSWTEGIYEVKGPNGNSIKLFASGHRNCDGGVRSVGAGGDYWSSTPSDSDCAWSLHFFSDIVDVDQGVRCGGCSVRLVQD